MGQRGGRARKGKEAMRKLLPLVPKAEFAVFCMPLSSLVEKSDDLGLLLLHELAEPFHVLNE